MDFRTLQYFCVVAKELNFTHAAEKLNMSQPPLSNQIKNLEDDLGVQLFIRGKRKMQLTEAGHLFLKRAEQMLALSEKTRTEISSMEDELSGTICIGMVEGRAPFLVSRWIKGFREEYPHVSFQLKNGSGDDVTEQLSRGLVDVALIACPYDREHLEGFTVGRGPWIANIPADHPLAKLPGDSVPLKALAGQPLIIPNRKSRIDAIRRWFADIDEEPDFFVETASYIDAMALVELNAGICIYPYTTDTAYPHVVTKLITDPCKAAEYAIVTERDQHVTLLAREFINYVQDCLEANRTHSSSDHPVRFAIPADAALL